MADLVDLLRARLAECSCPYGWSVGRTDLGRVDLKRWQEGCRVHVTKAELQADNDERSRWLFSLPEPEPVRRKRWWRR